MLWIDQSARVAAMLLFLFQTSTTSLETKAKNLRVMAKSHLQSPPFAFGIVKGYFAVTRYL